MIIIKSVKKALTIFTDAKYEAYLVGGCVRDLIRKNPPAGGPKDWDITTNAKPQEILSLFTDAGYKAFYENAFGTVTALVDDLPIEITPYRLEGKYSDKRRPDEIRWAKTVEEDLARRDFTINAMALALELTNDSRRSSVVSRKVIDLFGGQDDLKKKIVRTVGDPHERFSEDALRLMRAVRLAVELQFVIEEKTLDAIKTHASLLKEIAEERIRDEFTRIMLSPEPEGGIEVMQKTGLLACVLPELEEGIGIIQRGPHRHDVFTHNVLSLKWASQESSDLVVRLAALCHDIGKPRVRQEQEGKITFYDHPAAGARMTQEALERLHFPKKTIEEVSHLVYQHMFYYDVGKVTPSGVRRLLQRVGGREIFEKLLAVRRADRRATPVPKTHPYRLRHLQYMLEKVASDPLSRFQLVVNGDDVKTTLGIPEGMRIGLLLQALLVEVVKDPQKNTREYLLKRIVELNKKNDKELSVYGTFIKERQKERDTLLKEKYFVK